jgi:hypothetical protein
MSSSVCRERTVSSPVRLGLTERAPDRPSRPIGLAEGRIVPCIMENNPSTRQLSREAAPIRMVMRAMQGSPCYIRKIRVQPIAKVTSGMEILGMLLKGLGILSVAAAAICAGFAVKFSDLRSLGAGAARAIRPAAPVIIGGLGALGILLFWVGRSV